jgi:LEA14-like dessication related protein
MEQHMHIEIQAVQKKTMTYKVYEYVDVKEVDKYVKMHNNSIEFVATVKVEKNDNASSPRHEFA